MGLAAVRSVVLGEVEPDSDYHDCFPLMGSMPIGNNRLGVLDL
jgi:hypothetical protein